MMLDGVLFVSKRLQRASAALLLVAALQLVSILVASCTPEPVPMGAFRIHLNH